MTTHERAQSLLHDIEAKIKLLDLARVADEVDVMTGSRIVAWAAKGALARSSDHALPLPDQLDRWVKRRHENLAASLDAADRALDMALAAQADLTARLTLAAARELVEAEASPMARSCVVCAAVILPPASLVAGRCHPCYEYRRRHDGTDRPRSLWEPGA